MKELKLEEIFQNVSFEKIVDQIEILRNLNLENQDFNDLKELVRPLVKCGFSVITFPKGWYIFRGRPLEIGQRIRTISEISSPPISDVNKLNRASTGKLRVFYGGASRIIKDTQIGNVTSIFEISRVHDDDFEDPYEIIAIGRWYSDIDFPIAVVGLDAENADNNDEAIEMKRYREDVLEQIPDHAKIVRAVSEFMSEEFSKTVKESYEYKISAAFGELLFEYGIPGIMYPSVKTEGHSFNVALIHDFVESHLKCNLAAITRTRMIVDQGFMDYYLVSETINGDGSFNWTEPPVSAYRSNADWQRIEREIRETGTFSGANWVIKN